MKFCTNCGKQLNDDAKFCDTCGAPVSGTQTPPAIHAPEKKESRKQVFEGDIHKCPNCGTVLTSGIIKCPGCGFELRNIKASNAITDFSNKLNSISKQQKASFILSYPIPNTKEDFMEFLFLVSSEYVQQNYISMGSTEYFIYKAWESKYKQLKNKAYILKNDKEAWEQAQQVFKTTKRKMHPAIKALIVMAAIWIPLIILGIWYLFKTGQL